MIKNKYVFPDDYSFEERKIIYLTGIDQAWLLCVNTLNRQYRERRIPRIERTRKKNEIYSLMKKYLLIFESIATADDLLYLEKTSKTIYDAAKSYSGLEGIEHFLDLLS